MFVGDRNEPLTFVRAWVRPLELRLEADRRYRGRGVTIAFLDAGFYPHPDLRYPSDRIKAYVDVTLDREPLDGRPPRLWNWHGAMTSVIAAGSGHLSHGLYAGLAREAEVVLVKVCEDGDIRRRNVALGLRWVIENKERYGIRVVNLSIGSGEGDVPTRRSLVNRWVRKAVDAGLVVVVASGNRGTIVTPPASAPEAITVGGYYDHLRELYNSNFGFTSDGIHKPDLIAPAALVPSPILPGTPQQRRAEALVALLNGPEETLASRVSRLWRDAGLDKNVLEMVPEALRAEIRAKIVAQKVVTPYYEHADGTSVAAPIVSAVIAQMLEANPALTPRAVRNILAATATRLEGVSVDRQGHGVLCPSRAVEMAQAEVPCFDSDHVEGPSQGQGKIVFLFHDDQARGVRVAGDFNDWNPHNTVLRREPNGLWRAEVKSPPPGRYRYKFLVDEGRWVDDPWNARKEPDNWGGHNSVFEVS